ncbi:polysaccharide biosynthesis protein EpsC [Alkalihalobacillus alcalophilus ATCC 27647 = CGMCC 1.3604]|uniref:Polysaccharide biosynthesis protein EpsC n=1 Tax=Alkalihalobacillus alcalophilus ATCC 27647 = CGMCC 1.3604 TaxID=1218173 RepID=A0A094WK21_ALKAL|nr:nucleoside-diphosphate sugar epimerase/dehydratase [Alkalihalobacillus alcalophilus]KGA96278.1 polysaccharide biosynthesis protein EpsC [Alkalihalobacillus alcalophilus ATCC 27647 = CGMCC 1.3604]MED1563379.1 nucleoside-diphosphate sugar epimerase/dehydratase [Alkalihalobacillus alcalophilus]THG91654.1 polysaccharide biosynthesis protein EpsC [Alkalihalobacillus alcalophilus ATCC 27647 = CGMCC 1.3604]
MSYKKRLLYLILIDSLIVLTSVFVSFFLLSPGGNLLSPILITSSLVLLAGHHLFAAFFKLYKRAWQYASVNELTSIFYAVTFSVMISAFTQVIFFGELFLRTLFITWMMHIILIGGSRFAWRLYRDTYMKPKFKGKRTLIIGAGNAGTMIVRQLKHNDKPELDPVGFVDDDINKMYLEILDVPVLGNVQDITRLADEYKIEHIVIAIPSLNRQELQHIFQECSKTEAKTQILPRIEDLMLGNVSVNHFKDVEVEDLLGRDPVKLDIDGIADYITSKTVLVTGAGGSIGSEICRQIARFSPQELVLLGHGENSIYSIEMELRRNIPDLNIDTEIADVQDREKIFTIMEQRKPHVVFHAAAHKHVPLMERNPEEAVKNNVVGTKNVAEASSANGVNTFVMVSTDKAVNPTSVMGATKRIAEMIVQHMDMISETRFVAVRFGNVLGSRGSVIPLFKEQIKNGGPVTVTHPDMIRYFMTIPEASRLVLQAGSLAQGGEVFVLDMGEPVKIVDLAKNLIKLSGYTEEEIPIVFTGMRPGEKMFEELLGADEVHQEQVYPMIYRGKTPPVNINVTYDLVERFMDSDRELLRQELLDIANFRVGGLRVLNAVK